MLKLLKINFLKGVKCILVIKIDKLHRRLSHKVYPRG